MSTADWTGVPLATLLRECGPANEATRNRFPRRRPRLRRRHRAPLRAQPVARRRRCATRCCVAYAMNGAPLPPQHGAPLRLVVPRWYGMASVKWLQAIEAHRSSVRRLPAGAQLPLPPRGRREGRALHADAREFRSWRRPAFRTSIRGSASSMPGRSRSSAAPGRAPAPITRVRIRRRRRVAATLHLEQSAALLLAGLERVVAGQRRASTSSPAARPMRAGNVQPLEPPWDVSGFGNNGVQRVQVTVRA